MRRDDGTWLTLGLAGLGAAAAAVTAGRRGAANETEAVKVDYGRAVLTGELISSHDEFDNDIAHWDTMGFHSFGAGGEEARARKRAGKPLLSQEWPDKTHPYYLLAYDIPTGDAVVPAIRRRMKALIEQAFADDLPSILGIDHHHLTRTGWREFPRGLGLSLGFSFRVQDLEMLDSLISRLHAEDTHLWDNEIYILTPKERVSLRGLQLAPGGPDGPKINLQDLKKKRLLGGRWRFVRNVEEDEP
jgi:hypothetical protein